MMASFGYSASDIVAAIALIVQITKTLKASGGAPSEYQELVENLEQLKLILQHIEALQPSAGLAGHVNAVRATALSCRIPLSEFLDKTEKFRPALGAASSSGPWRGAARKVQWAVTMSDEIAKLQPKINMRINMLLLLLAIPSTQTLTSIESRNDSLLAQICEHREALANMHTDLLQAHSASKKMTASLTEICTGLRKDIISNYDHLSSDHRHFDNQIASLQREQTLGLSQIMSAMDSARL